LVAEPLKSSACEGLFEKGVRNHFSREGTPMELASFSSVVETCLTWIGYGVVCGTTAKLILPGRDPGGTFVTFVIGMGGALIGGSGYAWAAGHPISGLISPIGFAVAIGGALVLLLAHRLMSGRMYNRGAPAVVEEVIVPQPQYSRRRGRASARVSDLD
jgi:uncharacterized membrane protein YeaQ/YmgE (transglycosylase-associated protein family)